LTGCISDSNEQNVEEVVTTNFNTTNSSVSTISTIILTSDEYYLDTKQKEISQELMTKINSGELDITKVQTFYYKGYLVGSQIDYITKSNKGSKLRVKLILSDEYYLDTKQKEISQNFAESQNNTDIFQTQTIYRKGYLVAAEIWYLQS